MTHEEMYLKNYRMEDYERPSVAADIVAFMIRREEEDSYRHDPKGHLSVLLVRRGVYPFKGSWALPGGFLKPDETIEECAYREIAEETNVTPSSLMLFDVFSEVHRDPRGRIISNAFVCIISEDTVHETGGDDASDAMWFNVSFDLNKDGHYLLTLENKETVLNAILKETASGFGKTVFEITDSGSLAFDHAKIIASALTVLRNGAKDFDIVFDFLPEKFTLTALQKVQETIMDISILPANFRRKVAEYVEETDEYTAGAGHRPAKLYKRKQRD